MLEVRSMWSRSLISKSDESPDWTFRARAEPERRCVGARADQDRTCQSRSRGALECFGVWSPGARKYIELAEQDCDRFLQGSQVFSSAVYPDHFTKYFTPCPTFLTSRIASTSYSKWSSSIVAGGGGGGFWGGNEGGAYGVKHRSL